jgi:hypothetical protein
VYCCWGVEIIEDGIGKSKKKEREKGSNDETFCDICREDGWKKVFSGGGLWKNKYFILFSAYSLCH